MNPEIAKYIFAMHMFAPNSQIVTTDIPYFPINSSDIFQNFHQSACSTVDQYKIELPQRVFIRTISKFESDIKNNPELIARDSDSARLFFNSTIELLSGIAPDNVIFSLTNSDSLYFRIYKGDKEINLEVFYIKEDETDDIEAVVNIFENDTLILSNFGRLRDLFYKAILKESTGFSEVELELESAFRA